MRHEMSKPRRLKVRRYVYSLIDLHDYLDVLPGENISEQICVAELNGFLLNSMTNSWRNQAYVQGFDCKYIT